MMRVLVIGPEEKEAVHKLVEFAAKPENHYRPGPKSTVPGDDPRFVIRLNDFRCVFTFTVSRGGRPIPPTPERIWRHLSISVPTPNALPNPIVVEEVAHVFGFKGKLTEWEIGQDKNTNCIIVAQRI